MKKIEINGEVYVKESDAKNILPELSENVFMVRTYSAGVFYGEIEKRDGNEVKMKNARRVYKWAGAATLSQLSQQGTSKASECMFPMVEIEKTLLDVIEITKMTKKAVESLNSVEVWGE